MATLDLRGVRKVYAENAVVDGIDLQVADGAFVSLLGPSGCGKTTLLRMIAGFVLPDAGEIRVGETVLSRAGWAVPPERRRMSMIFQNYALWPHLTVRQNVAYGLVLRKRPKDEIAERLGRILEATRLQALGERYPGELSGGQQQRVALARALVVEPQTLLLDEPLSNLDANLREEMRVEIRRLHDRFGFTTVYVTHDQAEAMATADRIAVLKEGRIEQIGAPDEIYDAPCSEFVARFIGGTNIVHARHVGDGIVERDGLRLQCGRGCFNGAGEIVVSIRLQDVELLTAPPADAANIIPATVVHRTYLGSGRTYVVDADGLELRATTARSLDIAPGVRVWVRLPPDRCHILAT